MNNKLLSEKVKELRVRMAWSQSHLAEAAGLSTRTIQRLEQTGQCSNETLLSIAAALDIQIHDLTKFNATNISDDTFGQYSNHLLWKQIDPKRAFIAGGILLFPSFLFIVSNVLKYELDMPGAYDFVVSFGETTGLAIFAKLFTNPVFLTLSAFFALALCVWAQLNINIDRSTAGFAITGFHITFSLPCSLILMGSVAGLSILFGYVAIENLGQWAIQILEGSR